MCTTPTTGFVRKAVPRAPPTPTAVFDRYISARLFVVLNKIRNVVQKVCLLGVSLETPAQ